MIDKMHQVTDVSAYSLQMIRPGSGLKRSSLSFLYTKINYTRVVPE